MEAKAKLTVLFEDPFWVGVYERETDGRYQVCKITFGAEPRDYEVWDYLLKNWGRLPFSRPSAAKAEAERRTNPKRVQREIKRSLQSMRGVGTKAQQALAAEREQGKLERKTVSRVQRETEQAHRFAQKQKKRKEKRRGH